MDSAKPDAASKSSRQVDLDTYVPAYLTWTSNKLSRGASQCYIKHFDIGIETWRCLVLLAIDGAVSAPQISRVTGMDKSSVSRCFKSMQERGLIRISQDNNLGRARVAALTERGRDLHDEIREVAMERERVFLDVLSRSEVDVLLAMFRKLHENLPAVEVATQRFIEKRHVRPKAAHGVVSIEREEICLN